MNEDLVLKNTLSYDEWLIDHLSDAEEAHAYLEAALEAYEEDRDTTALLLSLQSVAHAQGPVGEFAKRSEYFRDLFDGKNPFRPEDLFAILSSLGFRIRLEPSSITTKSI